MDTTDKIAALEANVAYDVAQAEAAVSRGDWGGAVFHFDLAFGWASWCRRVVAESGR